MQRRTFLGGVVGGICLSALRPVAGQPAAAGVADAPFQISLAEWSLVKTLRAGKMTNLDFPRVARQEFDIDTIEFVDQFFADKARDMAYLQDLKDRADGEGVQLGLIMLDTNGPLGAGDPAQRKAAVESTFAWIDAAKFLGCHAIRVNARGDGDADALRPRVVESCLRLAEYAAPRGINVAIENHGGPSSDPEWLVSVMRDVNQPNFGTLPDFGNFPDNVDRYDAVEAMMPYAKAVSAKASRFTDDGLVAETDYFRMMRIVRDGGYRGDVGVESGARTQEGEARAVLATRDLLRRVAAQQANCRPIFNGVDLTGWEQIEGGEWTIADGTLIGRNGHGWSTDPDRSGSWLRTSRMYADFRLELQYSINTRGNSGILFRAGPEKNPAFTGYELQIFDGHGREPTDRGPSSIYQVAAPSENLVRPADQWNSVTIIASGPQIIVEMNGRRVIETEQTRSMAGYIGLQNHDDRSEVRFRNIRLEVL